jgi:hypothetical protein
VRPRSSRSARAALAWAMTREVNWLGAWPKVVRIASCRPLTPIIGLARYMTVWRVASRPASTVRTDTVLPAPTSPVITPMARSAMAQVILATASLWAAWRCSMPGARSRPNGMRVNP